RVALGVLPILDRGFGIQTEPEQIAFAYAHLGQPAIGGREAARDRKLAGRLFLHIDVDNDAVGRRTRLRRDPHLLEIAQILQPSLGARNQRAIVGIAFGDVEFAANDVVARADVAVNIDLLDIDALSVVDNKGEIDLLRLIVTVRLGPHGNEGEALPRAFD